MDSKENRKHVKADKPCQRWLISELDGNISMTHLEILDGPIDWYIKSKMYNVTCLDNLNNIKPDFSNSRGYMPQ